MNIVEWINLYSLSIIGIVLIIFTSYAVGKVQYYNGKIDQCTELGMVHSYENGCISCEESGRIMVNGKCQVKTALDNYNNNPIIFNNLGAD